MLTMRFNRTGKKNRVSYRIVLQEHTTAPGKRHVEILGSHDPHTKTSVLKEDRIQHWLKEGVQTSDAVYNLLVAKGLITGEKRAKKMPKPEVKEPEVKEEAAGESDQSAPEEAKEESVSETEGPAVEEVIEPAPAEPVVKETPEATEEAPAETVAKEEVPEETKA